MGIEIGGVPEAAPLSSEDARDRSIGRYLAQQRELRQISIEELAERMKIPRRSLERLEAGAFDSEPDGFVRGFVRTVADALGLDPDEAVMRLLREPPDDDLPALRTLPSFRTVAAGLLALLGIAVIGVTLWGVFATLGAVDRSAAPAAEGQLVYRRDAVRALAREQLRAASPVSVDTEGAGPGAGEPIPRTPAPADPSVARVRVAPTP